MNELRRVQNNCLHMQIFPTDLVDLVQIKPDVVRNNILRHHFYLPEVMIQVQNCNGVLNTRCGHVVRDFESKAKTRCNFQF